MRVGGGKGDVSSANTESPQARPDGEDRPVLWDPANAWPAGRKWIWAALATFVVAAQGASFLRSIRTTWRGANDFFQDWSSARNVLEGRPAYLPLSTAVSLYYPKVDGGIQPVPTLPWNGHPPSSVVAALPFGLLDYPEAGTLWNALGLLAVVVSLGLIFWELRLPVAIWAVLPALTLGLICNPIREIYYGQWNTLLLLLLTLAWMAERKGRGSWAGFWVAAAATLKLFPILLLLHFAVRRRWQAVIACLAWTSILSLATVAVVGVLAYQEYFQRILPSLGQYQPWWANASIPGFWTKNLGTGAHHYGLFVDPLMKAPLLANAGIVLSCALVLAIWYHYADSPRAADSVVQGDLCFSMTLVMTLLLTPTCWNHYLLLLALPLTMVWVGLRRSGPQRIAFLVLVVAIWVSPLQLWRIGGVDPLSQWPDFQKVPPRTYVVHRPLFPPLVLSVHFYALLALYLWLVFLLRREIAGAESKA